MTARTIRTALLLTSVAALGACATQPEIDPSELPPEATIDDGIDYYSASLGDGDILENSESQWTTDEEGNRVYLLNRAARGQSSSVYYVGDIRYLHLAADRDPNRRGTGYGNAPVYVSRGGSPLQSQTFRGSRNNTYYQTRRGRIVYLPGAQRPPSDTTSTNTTSNQPATSSSSGSQNNRPRPAVRPTVTSPTTRRTAPPRQQPQRRTRPTDESVRQDR